MRVVRPWQKGVVERLGKYLRTADSGITLIIPILDSMRKVDMREQVVDVPPQEVITRDNVVVTVDAVVYYEAHRPGEADLQRRRLLHRGHQAGADQPA